MPLTHEQIKALGAAILAAANDKFGLKTDGQGNVIIPEGSSFMQEVLKIDRKYIVLADAHHGTPQYPSYEQVFTEENITAMKQAGITQVFTELNTEQLLGYETTLARMPSIAAMDPYQEEIRHLKNADISVVAADPRTKELAKQFVRLDKAAHHISNFSNIMNIYKAETQGIEDTNTLAEKLESLRLRIFRKDLGDQQTISTNLTGLLKEACLLSPDNAKQIISGLAALMGSDASSIENRTKMTTVDLAKLAKNILEMSDSINTRLDALDVAIQEESKSSNLIIADTVKKQPEPRTKTVIQFGFGHFDETNDLNEALGKENCLVILTLASELELQALAQRTIAPETADKPDYIYIPKHTDNLGILIPEKAISVVEYLAAQEKKAQAPEVQKGNGR